ncbi:MAG: UDP-N-acetylmuramate dehydrogenase [bacterium]
MIVATCECIKGMKRILGSRFRMNRPLAPLTSLNMGGLVEFWAMVYDLEELRRILDLARSEQLRVRILGKGTNLVIQNGLLKGIVIQLGGTLSEIKRNNDRIGMGGGCPLACLLKEAITCDLNGAAPLAGIPGTLGGAITMNAGTDQGSLGDLVEEVDILTDGRIETWSAKEMGFGYRRSRISNGKIVLGARLRLKPGIDVKNAVRRTLAKRWSAQPYRERSAGCVFRNPPGYSAGRLIDEAGLKGHRIGQVEVSRKHANFFINCGGGTSDDFLRLMESVQKRVYMVSGVYLKPEVKFWVNDDER